MDKLKNILKEVVIEISPEKNELKDIDYSLKNFISTIKKDAEKKGIEIFIGGSYAKNTLIKKKKYDIDIFFRFKNEKKDSEISKISKEIIKKTNKKFITIHGSRDYFRIEDSEKLFFEIIPVTKIKKPEQAKNVTDLSYFHVKYIKNKIKNKNLPDEIKLAKSFCYANKIYGAESYIKGFSGYAIEVLVCYYGSFIKFLKEISNSKRKEKIIIDIEKHYKNKNSVLMDINSAKLDSPIILIDPTYKKRNLLAVLSEETLDKFLKNSKKFLKNPKKDFFVLKKENFQEKIKKSIKKKNQFILLEAETKKQKGDVAGSKLLKFYNNLNKDIGERFKIKNKIFEYGDDKKAKFFFEVSPKKEFIIKGPFIEQKKHVINFKKKHKKTFCKGKKIYSLGKKDLKIKNFVEIWCEKNKNKIKEMSIINIKIIK